VHGSLTTTVLPAGDGPAARERARSARDAKVDCFYVYPTVSDQPRTNATLARDPEVKAIARFQASRFSQHCRMFAPVYRQLTLKAIAVPRDAGSRAATVAYRDVRDAWREYLRKHNKGRGVVLIGHSQGTFMLRELIKREIDPSASARRRLISGLLIGGNVEVRKGSDRGGDFRTVRACRSAAQLGCVVGYSMFDQVPAPDARFARTPASGREILCTNPAALGGGSGTLDPYTPTAPFPGTIGHRAARVDHDPEGLDAVDRLPRPRHGAVQEGGRRRVAAGRRARERSAPGVHARARADVGPAPRRREHRARPADGHRPPAGRAYVQRAR
jgi:hypothetical protein